VLTLPSSDGLLALTSMPYAVQAVLDAMLLLVRLGSARGLAFAQAYRAFVLTAGSPADRRMFLTGEFALFTTDTSDAGPDSPAALPKLLATAQQEGREGEVLAAIERLVAAFPAFAQAHADALAHAQYLCYAGLAKNALDAGRIAEAIENDGIALSHCLRNGYSDEAKVYAARVDGLADRTEDGVDAAAAVVLMACALAYEAAAGDEALRWVRSIATKAVTGMIRRGSMNARAYGTLMLAATATRLGAALRTGVQLDPRADDSARTLLARIADEERAIGPQITPFNGEEMLLSTYVESDDREDGTDPVQRLRNLQRAFDTRIDQLAAARAADLRPPAFTLENLRTALDERTVLLHYFLGQTPDGRIATNVLLVTSDAVEATVIAEASFAVLEKRDLGGGLSGYRPPTGGVVEQRRTQVMTEPGPMRVVDRDGGDALATDLRRFLGPFVERLAALRGAGKTHLTIVPHGPLHFYPWSLLGGPPRPLGIDWVISVAPSLGFVSPPPDAVHLVPKTDGAAIGLTFAQPNRLGFGPLPNSATEAGAVAATLGVKPMLDETATKAAVLAALRRSKYVHISTHGRHAVVAPGFQFILCADEGDAAAGRLWAHELLAEDLRGLDLLTLSACETALGRYDLGDNLRGLPAAFFLAGVRTIVATLWDVSAPAAATFFTTFYAAIAGGASHRDAFGVAQAKTRADNPQYRDWGAFYLMGRPT
jgi:hypothetical protein